MITTRSFAVLGLLLATGLAIFGVLIGKAVQKGREFDRYLTVRGLSEREVKATLAIWPVRFAVTAEDLPSLKAAMEKNRSVVLSFLSENSISPDEVSTGIPTVSDRVDDRYTAEKPDLPRYKAIVTLVVRSAKVDIVKQAIQRADTLLEKGISLAGNEYSDRTEFTFENINEIKPAMIAEATASARAAAEKFAQDSKSHVGAIRKASQGALEINDRDIASPEKKILRVVTTVEFFLE
jgi:hypothetical protein